MQEYEFIVVYDILGCGSGVPISETLMNDGFAVHGIDASPVLVAAFRQRFPHATVACEPVENSTFFGRSFNAAVAWGLMFLLPAETQQRLIHRVAQALDVGGRFLFTAPALRCTWADLSTGRTSLSLGAVAYRTLLATSGLKLLREFDDEGENHYYDAVKR